MQQRITSLLTFKNIALLLSLVFTLAVIYLNFQFFIHAGPFWRDEINSVGIASSPNLSSLYSKISEDRAPALSYIILKIWMAVAGHSITAIRIYGFIIGLIFIGTIWLGAKVFFNKPPLFSLGLATFTTISFPFMSSIRPHGIGTVLISLTFISLWKLINNPTKHTALIALILSVASVQTLYQNAFVLFCICITAIMISIVKKDKKNALIIGTIGIISALSLLIYIPSLQQTFTWNTLLQIPSLGTPLFFFSMYFSVIPTFGLLIVLAIIFTILKLTNQPITSKYIYIFLTSLLSVISLLAFLYYLRDGIPSWHLMPVIIITAFGCESLLYSLFENKKILLSIMIAIEIIFISGLFPLLQSYAQTPLTNLLNVDVYIGIHAQPKDLIVTSAWYGIGIAHYNTQNISILTIPAIPDHDIHHYAELQQATENNQSINKVESDIKNELQLSKTIWYLGNLNTDKDSYEYAGITVDPQIEDYVKYSISQVAQYLFLHSAKINRIEGFPAEQVFSDENPEVWQVSGWKN